MGLLTVVRYLLLLTVRAITIVLVAPDDLSAAERSLWEAFPSGQWLDLRPDSSDGQIGGLGIQPDVERVIRAETIAALLLGARQPAAGCRPAIRLRGVQVSGRLDLMGATVTYALVCQHCLFDEPIRLVEATTKTVRIVDCQLPGFNGARMRADGIINFHRSEVAAGFLELRVEFRVPLGEQRYDHRVPVIRCLRAGAGQHRG